MTIQETLKKYTDVEIELLLAHTLNKPKEFLYVHPETKLTATDQKKLVGFIARRRAGEPIAYILGYKYFYGLQFKVNKQVLVPRPETEWLVERALAIVKSRKSIHSRNTKLSILDIGTGSGCIAISIAHSLNTLRLAPSTAATRVTLVPHKSNPRYLVTASDISESALAVAAQNAKTHKVDVNFVCSDLFKNIRGKFDVVIANLPYVPQGMYELLFHNLRYEPKVAITDGGEVWDIYAHFFTQLPKHLASGGVALLEIDDGSKPDLQKMLKKLLPGWKAKFSKDLGGLWRHLELQHPENSELTAQKV